MNTRKKKNYLSILLLLIPFLLTACTSEDQGTDEIITTIKGGRTGGAWSVFTEGIAEAIRKENKNSYITVEPGSIIENPPMVATNTVSYGLSYAATSYAAYLGEEPYPEAFDDLRAVSVVIPANYFQFLIAETVDFDSFAQIIEEKYPIRLAVNQPGSDAERITREFLNYYGVTYEDIIAWGGSVDYVSASKALEMMADGRINAFGNAESAPSSNILETATTTDLDMLSFDKEAIQHVADSLGMEENSISSDTYSFLDKDVLTISTPAILITHKDTSAEEVYKVADSIYHNLDYLYTVHEEFKGLTKDNMKDVGNVPLHPGAKQFFIDQGMIDSK